MKYMQFKRFSVVCLLGGFLAIFTSCLSQGELKTTDKAKRILDSIEKKYSEGDVESLIDDFVAIVSDSGKKIEDFVLTDGTKISEDLLKEIKKTGWKNELLTAANNFASGLKSLTQDDLDKYVSQIKKYSTKLGLNLFQSTALIVDYLIDEAIEFSKSDLMKTLTDLWRK